MGDENVVLYDESSPLEQTRRSILHYHDRPEETLAYLVELPEKRIDAPRPTTQPTYRPRRSTIINTLQLADTREAAEQPLEDYVRRNLPGFRKSLAPGDLQQLTTRNRPARESLEGGEVVRPATAEDIERDLMDSKKQKNKKKESLEEYENSLPEENPHRRRVTYQNDSSSEPKMHKHKDINRLEDYKSNMPEKTHTKLGNPIRPQNEYSQNRTEVVVMPALKPVSVSQQSPFFKDHKPAYPSSYNHLVSPVKLKVAIESSDEDIFGDETHRRKHHSKRKNSGPSSAKRNSPKESDEDLYERDKKKHKKWKHRQKSESRTKDSEESKDLVEESHTRTKRRQKERSADSKRSRNESRESSGHSSYDEKHRRGSLGQGILSRSNSVCLSGESGNCSVGPYIRVVNRPSKKENHSGADSFEKSRIPSGKEKRRVASAEKNRTNSAKNRTTVDKSSTNEAKGLPRSSEKRQIKSDDLVRYSNTTNPFGKEDPYSVHFFATKNATGKNQNTNPEANKQNKKVKDSPEKNPNTNPETNKQNKTVKDSPEKKGKDDLEKKGKENQVKKGKEIQEKKGGEDAAKNLSMKAPKSSKKVVAMRRYHIQIPEHGRPETWFNVRFNMNAENKVEMNYDGPVKINNYYASNNFI